MYEGLTSSHGFQAHDAATEGWVLERSATGALLFLPKTYFGARHAKLEAKNDNGVVVRSAQPGSWLYCGRWLGTKAIPLSDGQCGPDAGPQCSSCKVRLAAAPNVDGLP